MNEVFLQLIAIVVLIATELLLPASLLLWMHKKKPLSILIGLLYVLFQFLLMEMGHTLYKSSPALSISMPLITYMLVEIFLDMPSWTKDAEDEKLSQSGNLYKHWLKLVLISTTIGILTYQLFPVEVVDKIGSIAILYISAVCITIMFIPTGIALWLYHKGKLSWLYEKKNDK